MYNENSNYEAWAKLDEAMFTSSQIKQSEREAGETDWAKVYPTSLAETRKMERLLNEAIEVADDPNDPDFRERHNRLSEVVAWSLERNRTWRWSIIFLFSAPSYSKKQTIMKIRWLLGQVLQIWVSHAIFAPCLYVRSPTSQALLVCRLSRKPRPASSVW